MSAAGGRHGVTLLELLVVLTIMSIMAGVVGLALHTAQPVAPADAALARITTAADSAERIGRRVTIRVPSKAGMVWATAYPDGRVIADGTIAIDIMTGAHE